MSKKNPTVTAANGTVYTKEQVKQLLGSDQGWAERALVILWNRQTQTEQEAQATAYNNGEGFGAWDAPLLSSFAEQVQRGRRLSQKQLTWAFKYLPRYWRQVMDEIERSAKEPQEVAA